MKTFLGFILFMTIATFLFITFGAVVETLGIETGLSKNPGDSLLKNTLICSGIFVANQIYRDHKNSKRRRKKEKSNG